MKKTKKTIAISMAMAMAMAMMATTAGCSNTTGNSSGQSGQSSGSASQQQSGPTSQEKDTGEEKSNFNETGYPIVNEPMTQKMLIEYGAQFKVEDLNSMWFFQQMKEKTNVSFEIERVMSDQWGERKSLVFATNELPDVVVGGIANAEIIKYAQAKQIIPLNDLVEKYAPTYNKVLKSFKDYPKVFAPDGSMYGLVETFTGGYAEVPGSRAFINVEWLKKLNLSHPTTWNEFYDVLVAFRDKDPDGNGKNDTIPLGGFVDGFAVDPFVAGPLGISFGRGLKDEWQVVDNKIVHVSQHPQYKTYLENMNKMFTEKLLDQEYYTQNSAQYSAKGAAMQYGAFTCSAPFLTTGSKDKAIYGQFDVIGPLTSDVFKEKRWYGDNVNSLSFFLTSANKNPEVTLRYLDEIYTEDGAWLLVGPEKGEWKEHPEIGRIWNADKTKYTYDVGADKTLGTYQFVRENVAPWHGYRQFSEAMKAEQKKEEDVVLLDSLKKNIPYMLPAFPSLFFTPEEVEEMSLIQNAVSTYYKQMEAKLVMGEEPMSAYETMIKELKDQELDKLTEIYNAAYTRYMENVK